MKKNSKGRFAVAQEWLDVRAQKGLTQEEAAAVIGCSARSLQRWESGKFRGRRYDLERLQAYSTKKRS